MYGYERKITTLTKYILMQTKIVRLAKFVQLMAIFVQLVGHKDSSGQNCPYVDKKCQSSYSCSVSGYYCSVSGHEVFSWTKNGQGSYILLVSGYFQPRRGQKMAGVGNVGKTWATWAT